MTAPETPRLGVLATHPIQYQAPLYRELDRRGRVDLDVAFLSDMGSSRAYRDTGFGQEIRWDIDLLGGYQSRVLGVSGGPARNPRGLIRLAEWIRGQDAIVVHGHRSPWMLTGALVACGQRRPYLLRGESWPRGGQPRWRVGRDLLARLVVRNCAAGLSIGEYNDAFYAAFGAPRRVFAPYSVDNDRFQRGAEEIRPVRDRRLKELGLLPEHPVVLLAAKLIPRKRPLDLIDAVHRLDSRVNLLIVGDGPLRAEVEALCVGLPAACTGFVGQAELPAYYGLADVFVLPSERETWGLVVNEAMAAGALPVVSDAVGAAPDLVRDLGLVFPVGDVARLAECVGAAVERMADPALRDRIRDRIARYSISATAEGFERAAAQALQAMR